jgi:predicted xylose isomerase-like sugar epimerase
MQVAVHLVSDAGYIHAYRIAVATLTHWLEAAQNACPDLGVVVMSVEESDRTEYADMARNAAIWREQRAALL